MNNEAPQVGDTWYRIDTILYHACDCGVACHHPARPDMTINKYRVEKVTPQGVWLGFLSDSPFINSLGLQQKLKWVCLTTAKRFACPTLKSAYESFLARKKAQKRILERQMYYADHLIRLAEKKVGALGETNSSVI